MSNDLKFEGTDNEIINQLSKYMSKSDAEKFFNNEFINEETKPKLFSNRMLIVGSNNTLKRVASTGVRDCEKKNNKSNEILANGCRHQINCGGVSRRTSNTRRIYACKNSSVLMPQMSEGIVSKKPSSFARASSYKTQSRLRQNVYKGTSRHSPILINSTLINENLIQKKPKKHFSKVFSIVAFVAIAVALDIGINCLIGHSIVSTIFTVLPTAINNTSKKYSSAEHLKNSDESVSFCIYSIVYVQNELPKHSSLIKSNCKNYCLNCDFRSGAKCHISKKKYAEISAALINDGTIKI